jgi:hypothetical protein
MSISFWIFCAVAPILLLLGWWLLAPTKSRGKTTGINAADGPSRGHTTYFPQIRQALAEEDLLFVDSKDLPGLSRRVRKERRRVILVYVSNLQVDFARLWRLARVLAAMSPHVAASLEVARVRLSLAFYGRYLWIRVRLRVGLEPLPSLSALSELVGNLAVRLETVMNELGERAALGAELASPLHRGGLDTP